MQLKDDDDEDSRVEELGDEDEEDDEEEDGVNEAFNPQSECYGNDRLLRDLAPFAGQPATAVTAGLLQHLRAFVDGAPQSDDIAVLVLRVT